MEKIVRDYFPYITEIETTTFTDCVNCLIAFTNSRFNKDISLSAIGFLRYCAKKLAEGDLDSWGKTKDKETSRILSLSSPEISKDGQLENGELSDKVDHLYLWFPLLAGLSELSFDPRPEIRKSALQILFDTLRNEGHIFSLPLWERVFESVLFRVFDNAHQAVDSSMEGGEIAEIDQDSWLYETCTSSLELIVDLFVKFYSTANPLLKKVSMLLVSFIQRPHQNLDGVDIAAFVRLISNAGDLFSDDKWLEVVLSLKEAATSTLPDFTFVSDVNLVQRNEESIIKEGPSESIRLEIPDRGSDNSRAQQLYASISDVKCQCAVQLLLIQAVMEIYAMYRAQISTKNVCSIQCFACCGIACS